MSRELQELRAFAERESVPASHAKNIRIVPLNRLREEIDRLLAASAPAPEGAPSAPLSGDRLRDLHRLHAEAVANKGGDFEIDTDEAFRLAMMQDAPALIDMAARGENLRPVYADAETEVASLRTAARELVEAVERLGEFYLDLDDAPDGAVPAWDLVALKRDAANEALEGSQQPAAPAVTGEALNAAIDELVDATVACERETGQGERWTRARGALVELFCGMVTGEAKPAADAERERAIEAWRLKMIERHTRFGWTTQMMLADVAEAVALMRSAPAASGELVQAVEDIPATDIKVDTYSGIPSMNAWVRVTHLPTGLSAESGTERSQLKNRQRAMAALRTALAAERDGQKGGERL